MPIKLSDADRRTCIDSIRAFFADTLDEEIGMLRATLLLEFCLEEIAPTIYNRAVADAQAYFAERVADLDGSCHEIEFPRSQRGAPGAGTDAARSPRA